MILYISGREVYPVDLRVILLDPTTNLISQEDVYLGSGMKFVQR